MINMGIQAILPVDEFHLGESRTLWLGSTTLTNRRLSTSDGRKSEIGFEGYFQDISLFYGTRANNKFD
jgi:hypothetical protein